MTPDIAAACARLRRAHAGENPVDVFGTKEPPPNYVGKWSVWSQEEAARERWCSDEETLADAFLAQHHADDKEPINLDWLKSIGFVERDGEWRLPLDGLSVSEHPVRWKVEYLHPRTRGDLRALCRVLQIDLSEKGGG